MLYTDSEGYKKSPPEPGELIILSIVFYYSITTSSHLNTVIAMMNMMQ